MWCFRGNSICLVGFNVFFNDCHSLWRQQLNGFEKIRHSQDITYNNVRIIPQSACICEILKSSCENKAWLFAVLTWRVLTERLKLLWLCIFLPKWRTVHVIVSIVVPNHDQLEEVIWDFYLQKQRIMSFWTSVTKTPVNRAFIFEYFQKLKSSVVFPATRQNWSK